MDGFCAIVGEAHCQSYGFSDKVGLVSHGDEESVYLSSKKKDEIEGEIRTCAQPSTYDLF